MENKELNEIIEKNTASKYIKEKCYKRAKEIYGEDLPKDIEKRLKLELDSIIKNNFESKYLLASYVVQKSQEMGYLTYTRGSVGNSFVAYLLEITDFNPIQYNLPFEMFASIEYDKEPDIVLNISEEIKDNMLKSIEGLKEEIEIYGVEVPTFLKKLQKVTKIHPQDINFDDADTLALFSKADTKGIFGFEKDFMINMLKQVKIKNFNDLVCVSALNHGTNTWSQNAEYLVRNLDIPIDMLVSNRADVMNYLMQKEIDKQTAYDITEFIRKVKASKANDIFDYSVQKADFQTKWEEYKEILSKHHIPEYFIESCEKIKYLFPKAHCIAEVEIAFRIAWYKVHYPEAFYKAYFETYKAIDINYYYTKNEVKNKLKRLYDERLGNKNEIPEINNQIMDLEILLEMFEREIKKDEKRKLDDYDLINSKAIGDYCREIGHKFNPEELAVLVYRNKKMSIEEKIAKYQDLIDNYPDMEVVERINCNHYASVKTLIQNEIDRIKSLYDDFVKEEKNCIYAWDEYNRSTKSYSRTNDVINNLKSTYKEVYTEVIDYINEYDDTISFTITKKYLDNDGSIYVNYIVIDKKPNLIEINREYEDLPDIEGIFVNIPVPFKKGDILVNKILPDFPEKHIFVLNSLTVWNKRMLENFFTRNLDTSDMSGNGYYLDDVTHQVILDHVLDYDSFEFYNGELEGENRILKLISSFLKGKIDNLELFIKAYESFKSDYERKMPNIFVDEDLKLAGFNDWDISKIKGEHEKIYNMEYEEKMDYIRHNTIALKGIKEEDIKQIETDYYDDVFVLTIDGKLYKNGQRIDTKIEKIHMFDGLHLYKVTDSNRIRPIDKEKKWDDIDTYLNNKDCSYKKVLMSTMNIIALTKDGNVRAIHEYPSCVIPENYVGVEDIKIEDKNGIDIPYVFKDNKYVKLYIN